MKNVDRTDPVSKRNDAPKPAAFPIHEGDAHPVYTPDGDVAAVHERLKCSRCQGRGWINVVQSGRDATWPDPCPRCKGSSRWRPSQLARALGVSRANLYRVRTGRAGTRACVRVLDAIRDVFPEAVGCET